MKQKKKREKTIRIWKKRRKRETAFDVRER